MAEPSVIVFSSSDVSKVPMLSNNQTFTGTNTFNKPVVITKAIGTAPLTITSTTKVTNLNVDMIDGLNLFRGSGAATAGTTTIITNVNTTTTSTIILQATSAGFAGLTPYISAKNNGSFVITTTIALGTETFDYIIIG